MQRQPPTHILGTDITLQRLQRETVEEITAALAVSGQDPHSAEGAWQHAPSETQTTHAARAATARHTETHETPDAVRNPAPAPSALAAEPAAGREHGTNAATAGEELGVFPALLAAAQSPTDISLPIPPAAAPPAASTPPVPAAEASGTAGPDQDAAPRLPAAPDAPGGPVIRVLGPATILGASASRHGTREAQLAALLHLEPGRSAGTLCADMDPASPWTTDTLNARLGGLRRSLGKDDNGNSYVPRRAVKSDPYTLSTKICCDWHHFQQTVEAALPHGPDGLNQLEKALDQVHGKPFGTLALPWSQPLQQEMVMRIISVAHTVATYRLAPGLHHDLTLARRAIATGLEVDDTAELLYRDWLRIEAAAGNRGGLNTAISRLDEVNRSLNLPMEIETEQLIRTLLDQTSPAKPM
ncbi:bacterial transcriptional activator domain-containing protein [Streptomyces sp. NPDC002853]